MQAHGRSAGSGGDCRVSSLCGGCGVGIEGSCGLLHVGGETGGGEEWPNVCAAGWWYGATVGNAL